MTLRADMVAVVAQRLAYDATGRPSETRNGRSGDCDKLAGALRASLPDHVHDVARKLGIDVEIEAR